MNDNNASQYWGLYAEYKLTMTNGQPSEIFHYQFSDDEWRKLFKFFLPNQLFSVILPTDIAFLVTNFIFLAISYIVGCKIFSRNPIFTGEQQIWTVVDSAIFF